MPAKTSLTQPFGEPRCVRGDHGFGERLVRLWAAGGKANGAP